MARALYLYGGWSGHKPYEVASWANEQMDSLGFSVVETQDPFRLEEDLTEYDLIVLGWGQRFATEDLTPEQEASLLSAVEHGTGVAGWHGMAASWGASLPYHFLIGGSFVEHPGGEGVPVPFDVRIVDRNHEVTAGVQDFKTVSEQYYMHIDPTIHVLADCSFSGEFLPWIEGTRMPVAWAREWGSGRIFYCSIGHTPEELLDPQVTRLIRQGLSWAARKV